MDFGHLQKRPNKYTLKASSQVRNGTGKAKKKNEKPLISKTKNNNFGMVSWKKRDRIRHQNPIAKKEDNLNL